MTFRQSRKHVMMMLIGWNRPPVVSNVTTNNGRTFTLQMLTDTMQQVRYAAPPPVHVVMTPQMAKRFAETTIDQSLYGTICIMVDPTVPPGEAYLIQSPRVAQ